MSSVSRSELPTEIFNSGLLLEGLRLLLPLLEKIAARTEMKVDDLLVHFLKSLIDFASKNDQVTLEDVRVLSCGTSLAGHPGLPKVLDLLEAISGLVGAPQLGTAVRILRTIFG